MKTAKQYEEEMKSLERAIGLLGVVQDIFNRLKLTGLAAHAADLKLAAHAEHILVCEEWNRVEQDRMKAELKDAEAKAWLGFDETGLPLVEKRPPNIGVFKGGTE